MWIGCGCIRKKRQMKNRIQIAALLLSFAIGIQITAAETGEWRHSLDGIWQFTTNTEVTAWESISVPGNWDTLPAYSTYKGKGWYRREFVAPADWQDKHVRLKFDAVYHDATVTLNGKQLGLHSGGYTPFEFEVTDVVKLGATNTVTVCADSTYRRGAWWHWGGISRSVIWPPAQQRFSCAANLPMPRTNRWKLRWLRRLTEATSPRWRAKFSFPLTAKWKWKPKRRCRKRGFAFGILIIRIFTG